MAQDRPDEDPSTSYHPPGAPDAGPAGYGYGYPEQSYPPQQYAPPQYGGYPPPQPGYPAAPRPTNTMAILALVFAFVFSPIGIVFGIIARRQIRQTGEAGEGLAKAGLILSVIFTALAVLSVVAMIVLLTMAAGAGGFPV